MRPAGATNKLTGDAGDPSAYPEPCARFRASMGEEGTDAEVARVAKRASLSRAVAIDQRDLEALAPQIDCAASAEDAEADD